MLSKAQIILFLNKCDLRTCLFLFWLKSICSNGMGWVVDKKLKSGIKVKDYVPSFGDRKNDLPTVAQCKS